MHKILVIDDDLDVRDSIGRVLERAGYIVRTSPSAAEGLAELARQPADLVVTDIIMPKMNGVEAIRAILARFPKIRIIAISGGGNFGIESYKPNAITTNAYLAAATDAGAHFVLTKPFDADELTQAVGEVLGTGNTYN